MQIELVTFRTPTMEADRFVAANGEINDWLKRQPGFINRRLGVREDGTWVDILFWEDGRTASEAAAKLVAELGQCAAMAAIDPASIDMSHAPVRLSVGG